GPWDHAGRWFECYRVRAVVDPGIERGAVVSPTDVERGRASRGKGFNVDRHGTGPVLDSRFGFDTQRRRAFAGSDNDQRKRGKRRIEGHTVKGNAYDATTLWDHQEVDSRWTFEGDVRGDIQGELGNPSWVHPPTIRGDDVEETTSP